MAFNERTVIIEKSTGNSFQVVLQDKSNYVLTPRKLYGFSKKPDEWIFIRNLDETTYRVDSNYQTINNAVDFFEYKREKDYELTDEEFAVLAKCREREEYVPDSLLINIFLISAFAELLNVNKGELVKKLVSIAKHHPEYEKELHTRIKENEEIRKRGIDKLNELGH
jgi:hypothetical protein